MKITKDLGLWAEKYRPSSIDEVILPKKYKDYFKNIEKTKELPHLIFSGPQGRGKTSLAKALAKSLDREVLYINASLDNSIDNIRYNVSQFAKNKSISGKKKVVILDEAERLQAAQEALKVILEETSKNCSFIFCTNNIHKIIKPLQSRCQVINFEYDGDERKEVAKEYYKRVEFILKNEGIEFDKKVVVELIKKLFPDLRKIINTLQQFSLQYEKITKEILNFASYDNVFDELIVALKKKDFKKIRELATQIEAETFYRFMYNKIDKVVADSSKPQIILILSKYAYQHALSIDQEINLVACLIELANNIKWRKANEK